jgi:hypothetical protein
VIPTIGAHWTVARKDVGYGGLYSLWRELLATAHLTAMLQTEPVLVVNFTIIPALFYRAGRILGFTRCHKGLHSEMIRKREDKDCGVSASGSALQLHPRKSTEVSSTIDTLQSMEDNMNSHGSVGIHRRNRRN